LLLLSLCLYIVAAIEFKNRFDQDHSNYGDYHNNKEHIQEHLESLVKEGEENAPKLSEEDTIYYLFALHDANGDGYLDGHELLQAFTDFGEGHGDVSKYLLLEEVTEMIDHVLEEDDLNGDGLISWDEYLQSQLYH
ncbi:hypothetical protein K501DRAFT_144539, partial [Backusella circina FSU 941]